MDIDKKIEEPLFYIRTPLENILKITSELWEDSQEFAHKIGVKAAEIIRDSYLKNPFELYGKKPSALIAGAVYLAMNSMLLCTELNDCPRDTGGLNRSLVQIAYVCEVGETSLRNRAQQLAKLLNIKTHEREPKKEKGI